jgi:hypothetical protein
MRDGALVARNWTWTLPGRDLRTVLRLGLGSECQLQLRVVKTKQTLYFTVLTFTQHWPSRTNKSTGTMFP